MVSSCRVLTWPSLCAPAPYCLSSLVRTPVRLDQGPTLVTSSNLHHLLHVDLPVSKYRHAGVWASTWKCGGTKSVHSQGRSVMSAEASSRNFPQLQRKRMTPFLILFFNIRNVLKFCISVLGASTAAQSACLHLPTWELDVIPSQLLSCHGCFSAQGRMPTRAAYSGPLPWFLSLNLTWLGSRSHASSKFWTPSSLNSAVAFLEYSK